MADPTGGDNAPDGAAPHPHDPQPPRPVGDVDRALDVSERPTPDAQWDELHGRWERWDEDGYEWVVVGEDPGDGVAPADENPLPPLLTRVLHRADELDALEAADDLHDAGAVDESGGAGDHSVPQPGPAPADAQWDEILGRWVSWDTQTNSWLEVPAADPDR